MLAWRGKGVTVPDLLKHQHRRGKRGELEKAGIVETFEG